MTFPEHIKLSAKKKSHFRCCICHKKFVEVHHIIPESENGKNDIQNTAPLCASCHDLFGGNPSKRKQIREMRDYWWEKVNEIEKEAIKISNISKLIFCEDKDYEEKLKEKAIAIYHIVYKNEGFEETVHILFEMVKKVQEKHPNKKRVLFLDIENHKNEKGGFDDDLYELQRYFILEFLSRYLSEVHMPLISFRTTQQKNDFYDKLKIFQNKKEIKKYIKNRERTKKNEQWDTINFDKKE